MGPARYSHWQITGLYTEHEETAKAMQRLDSVPQWCRTPDLSSVQTMKTRIHCGALHNTAARKAMPTVTRDGAAVERTTLLID